MPKYTAELMTATLKPVVALTAANPTTAEDPPVKGILAKLTDNTANPIFPSLVIFLDFTNWFATSPTIIISSYFRALALSNSSLVVTVIVLI